MVSSNVAVTPHAALAGLCVTLAAVALSHCRPSSSLGSACDPVSERRAVDGLTVEVQCAGGPPLRGPARLLYRLTLDLNETGAAALESLPGIGPARAAAIERERLRGRFESVADLERVHGIGPLTAGRLRRWLSVVPAGGRPAESAEVAEPRASGQAFASPATGRDE